MSKLKIIISLIICLYLTACERAEDYGKEVLYNNEYNSTDTSKEVGIKDAIDILNGKCILIDSNSTLYPMIVSFGSDYYIEYIKDSDGPYYEVLELISDDKSVTYKVESSYYESIEYEDISIELIDENTIKYIGDRENSKTYTLMSKAEVALYMKEYEEKVENGLTIENKKEDYIIYDSNTRLLDKSELINYSKKELAYIRNEIFARHGYIFKSEEYNEYFGGRYWYTPDPNFDGDINSLSEIEKANVDLIKELEGEN